MKEMEYWVDPTWLWAWIVMLTRFVEEIGVPDMIPDDGLRERPEGREPSMIENDKLSPWHWGVVLKKVLLGMMNMVWE